MKKMKTKVMTFLFNFFFFNNKRNQIRVRNEYKT